MVKVYRPRSLKEALEIREAGDTTVLAGGSDLMVKHRRGRGMLPDLGNDVLFIAHLPELQEIVIDEDTINIGAACTLAGLLNKTELPEWVKAPLAEMASPPVRNLATLGGNICNSSPAGDSLPMLYALDARLLLQSGRQSRIIGIMDFITGPGQNLLQSDELLVQVQIPRRKYLSYYYRKVGSRKANSISKVSFFAVADQDKTRVHEVRIALGAVAPRVVRIREGEILLAGVERSEVPTVVPAVLEHYQALIQPIDDLRSSREYRWHVAMGLLRNYLLKEL